MVNKIFNKKIGMFLIVLLILNFGLVFAQESFGNVQEVGTFGSSLNPQFNNPSFFGGSEFISPSVYWPEFDKENCYERQDFIMQIAPEDVVLQLLGLIYLKSKMFLFFVKLWLFKLIL